MALRQSYNQAPGYQFRIQTNVERQTFYIEESVSSFFSSWKRVHEPGLFHKPLEFLEYADAVHWIEHEVCRRVGLIIQNTHFRD